VNDSRDVGISVELARLAAIWRTGNADEVANLTGDSLTAVVAFQNLARISEDLQVQAARAAHEAGVSWNRIGSTLGVSRQAAQQRFDVNYSVKLPRGPETRILGPVARDEEMYHLEVAGSQGWKLVDARHGEHALQHQGGAWEVKRVSIFSLRPLPTTHEGWTAVSARFPDCFYVRHQ
jgi:hypothetical protein